MTQGELGQLPREDLIEAFLQLQTMVEALRAENETLQKQLADKQKPPTNSRHSSQPPSLDRKSNQPSDKRKHRHGPPHGHEKHERQFVASPDHGGEVKAQQCDQCQFSLEHEAGQWVAMNQITELPPARAEVIEVHPYAVRCPVCEQVTIAQPPSGLEMNRTFGARPEATVVYYRQEQHLSYERTQQTLMLFSLWSISPLSLSLRAVSRYQNTRLCAFGTPAFHPPAEASGIQVGNSVNGEKSSLSSDKCVR